MSIGFPTAAFWALPNMVRGGTAGKDMLAIGTNTRKEGMGVQYFLLFFLRVTAESIRY